MQPQTDTTQSVGEELMSNAQDIGNSAVNRLHSEIDARKSNTVTQVKSVSSAIGQAAAGLDPNVPTWLKSAFEQSAQQVQKFAETLERKDSRQLASDVSDFASQSPGTFLAACAAAGFAAARIFKAGNAHNSPSQPGPVGENSGSNPQKNGSSASSSADSTRGQFA